MNEGNSKAGVEICEDRSACSSDYEEFAGKAKYLHEEKDEDVAGCQSCS